MESKTADVYWAELERALANLAGAISSHESPSRQAVSQLQALVRVLAECVEGAQDIPASQSSAPFTISRWADSGRDRTEWGELRIHTRERRHAMTDTLATGEPVVSNGLLGADIIRVPAGAGFSPHTHPGDHMLFVLAGTGTIAYRGELRETHPGEAYMVEGLEAHAVGAITDHVLLAVGSPHRSVDSPSRQTLVDYSSISADLGGLTCHICLKSTEGGKTLFDLGCPHCPSQWLSVSSGEGRSRPR